MFRFRMIAWGLWALCVLSCNRLPPPPAPIPDTQPVEMPGIPNLHRVDDRLWSGSTPEGEAGFQTLRDLKVTTIVSVDGAKPDLELARKYGLNYIHIPVGYDGISRVQFLRLARAAETPGFIFVHCHHGKHRGPTAAVLLQRFRNANWTEEQSLAFMELAGTDRRYEGLFAAVKNFRPPTAEEMMRVPLKLPDAVDVGGLTAIMVEVDYAWSRLKSIRGVGTHWSELQSSIDDPFWAVSLNEHYREAGRHLDKNPNAKEMRAAILEAENDAKELEVAIRDKNVAAANRAFHRSANHCINCHRHFRDQAK